jgi:hypothetical protein
VSCKRKPGQTIGAGEEEEEEEEEEEKKGGKLQEVRAEKWAGDGFFQHFWQVRQQQVQRTKGEQQ